MPTIDELPQAVSVSDGDELVLSQSDTARKATRAQLLSGVQAQLALATGSLLGRMSPGIGAPEAIALGANLTLSNGAVSAPAAFEIDGLSIGRLPAPLDLIPLGQGGQNAAVPYGTFMSGIGSLPGIDISNLAVSPTGGSVSRRLADCFADALTVESFGALGDGVTDDTNAFIAAAAGEMPVRLDGRVYIVNGPLQFTTTSALLGIAGQTVIRRTRLVPSSFWINIASLTFDAFGVIFDSGSLAGVDMPAVSVSAACTSAAFTECTFLNARGVTSGSGLSVTSTLGSNTRLAGCTFKNNDLHGIHAIGLGTMDLAGCNGSDNGGCGVRIESGVACTVRGGVFSSNGSGISVGDWNTGVAPAQIGPGCVIGESFCGTNTIWGIAVSAAAAIITGNTLLSNGTPNSGGGVLARLGGSRLHGNAIYGESLGVDARGCWGSAIAANHITNATVGIAAGGSQNLTINGNTLLQNVWSILITAIEPTLSATPTGPLSICGNWIGFSSALGGGISVLDAASGVAITDNDINGWGSADYSQAMWLHTDAAVLHGNRWNNEAQFSVQASPVAGLEALVVPDTTDEVLVLSAPNAISAILTAHQANTLGQITFIKVTSGGAGYTQAQIALSGSGTGASANVVVNAGRVIWIVVTNPGSGYGLIGSMATATITGDGSGATALAYVGLPVVTGRNLRLSCNCTVQLALQGSSPAQQSWTGFASTIPALGSAELQGVYGGWRATAFPPVDYVVPTGDGGAILQSVGGGNLTLRPSSGGAIHLSNASEASGCTSSVGRGSPLGSLPAPPGSDFRNLNGGAGNTYWIKQNNTDATGWIAIA